MGLQTIESDVTYIRGLIQKQPHKEVTYVATHKLGSKNEQLDKVIEIIESYGSQVEHVANMSFLRIFT
jgi:hypothetical protein